MQKRRTQHFKITFGTVSIFSALFLLWFGLFGTKLAVSNMEGVLDTVIAVMGLATGSFLVFSFLPYFRGDKRWYSISALLVAVFFVGAVMLWRVPVGTVVA